MSYPYQLEGDYFLLAGLASPGLCDGDNADAPLGYDERRGYGRAGSYLFFKGEELSKFGVRIRVYRGGPHFEQYPSIFDYMRSAEWRAFRGVYAKPPRGTRPKAMDFIHPITAELGIRAVVTLNELGWKRTTEDGEWTKEIRFCTYRAPKPSYARPFASKERPVPVTATDQL